MATFQDRLLAVAKNAVKGDPVTTYDPAQPVLTPDSLPKPVQSSPDVPIPDVTVVDNGPAPDAVQYSAQPSAEQTPKLAEPGPKNAVLKFFGKAAGLVGEEPAPGQPYKGPITTTDKINAGARFVGKLGNAMAAAGGTPEEKELAEKRAEFGPELKAKTDLANRQLEALEQYRVGTLGVNREKNDIASQKNDIAMMKASNSMRLKGYVPDEQNPGAFRPMNEDEILSDPILSQNRDVAQAAIMSKQANASLAKAHADAILNPENPVYQQQERKIQAMADMARARLAIARDNLSIRGQALQMRGQEEMANFGQNFLTGEKLNNENAPSGSMYLGPDGQPVPLRSQSGYAPTANMRTQAQMAQTIQPMVPKIVSQIQALSDKIGPGAGRWNDFWVNKAGVNDKDFAALNTDLSLFATALGKAHFGSRIPAGFVDDMMKQFGEAQDPDNLINRIQHADAWVAGYAAAHPKTVGSPGGGQPGQNGGKPAPSGGNSQPSSAAPQIGEIRKGHKFIGGDPADPNSWQAVKAKP